MVERDIDGNRPVARLRELDAVDLPGAIAVLPGRARYRLACRRGGGQRQTHLPGVQLHKVFIPKPDRCARPSGAPRPDGHVGHALDQMDVDESGVGGDGLVGWMLMGGVDRRRHGAERGDDRDDDRAGQSLDRGVAAQPQQRVSACGDAGVLQKPRR